MKGFLTIVLSSSLLSWALGQSVQMKQTASGFDQHLADLANTATPSPERDDEDKVLRAIAKDRVARPEVYHRLMDRYVYPKMPGGYWSNEGTPHAAELLNSDVTSANRLVWEYLLLRPLAPGCVDLSNVRIVKALSRIALAGDSGSLPALRVAFSEALDPGRDNDSCRGGDRQSDLLVIAGSETSLEGLDLFLQMGMQVRVWREIRQVASPLGPFHTMQELNWLLEPPGVPDLAARWKPILSEYRRLGRGTAETRAFLDEILH
jgi:hypothetical protein